MTGLVFGIIHKERGVTLGFDITGYAGHLADAWLGRAFDAFGEKRTFTHIPINGGDSVRVSYYRQPVIRILGSFASDLDLAPSFRRAHDFVNEQRHRVMGSATPLISPWVNATLAASYMFGTTTEDSTALIQEGYSRASRATTFTQWIEGTAMVAGGILTMGALIIGPLKSLFTPPTPRLPVVVPTPSGALAVTATPAATLDTATLVSGAQTAMMGHMYRPGRFSTVTRRTPTHEEREVEKARIAESEKRAKIDWLDLKFARLRVEEARNQIFPNTNGSIELRHAVITDRENTLRYHVSGPGEHHATVFVPVAGETESIATYMATHASVDVRIISIDGANVVIFLH